MNFMSQWLSPKGTVGGAAWRRGTEAGYSPKQMKVAIQQLVQSGVGVNNAPGQFFSSGGPMRGVPGIASPKNPLGRFQGPHGNLGLGRYESVKKAGYNIADIPSLAAQSGMYLPEGAHKQWTLDMQSQYEVPEMPEWNIEFPEYGSTMGGGLTGTSSRGVRSNLGSQDNTGSTTEAFGRDKKKKAAAAVAGLLSTSQVTG